MTNFLLKSDIDEICERVANLAETFSGKKILLTGARGFLGRYFVEIFAHLNQTILDKPAEIIALDNLITAGKQGTNIPELPNVTFINHDVTCW